MGVYKRVVQPHLCSGSQAPQMYPYPVSNSVPGQQGKYRGAKGEQGQEGPHAAPPAACWQMELELCTVFPPPASVYSCHLFLISSASHIIFIEV